MWLIMGVICPVKEIQIRSVLLNVLKTIKETEAYNIKLYIIAAARLGSHQTRHLLEK